MKLGPRRTLSTQVDGRAVISSGQRNWVSQAQWLGTLNLVSLGYQIHIGSGAAGPLLDKLGTINYPKFGVTTRINFD